MSSSTVLGQALLESPVCPGERRSWRVGLGCKPSASVLSGFESLLPHMTAPDSGPARSSARLLALALTVGGVLTIAIGAFLGATVEPLLYLIALSAITDFALA